MTKAETPKSAEETKPTVDVFNDDPYDGELDAEDRAGGTSAPGTQFYGITQNQGTDVQKIAHAGQFYTKDKEGNLLFFTSLDVVILDAAPRSTRFEDDHVACKSYDNKTGNDGQTCKECKYFFFRENDVKKEDKCRNSMILLCIPADDYTAEPFFLQISASAFKDWRKYANDVQNVHNRPIFSMVTRVTTILRKEGPGLAYMPVFTPIKGIKSDVVTLREIRKANKYRFDAPEDAVVPSGKAETETTATETAGVSKDDFVDPFNEE